MDELMLIPSQCYLMETRDEVTKISRQRVETIQEEPKLKFINVVGWNYHIKSEA